MTTMTHDTAGDGTPPGRAPGSAFAVLSAMSFGMSGTLARGLLDAGWTPGAAVTARIVIAALVLLVPGLVVLRGRWHLLRANAGFVVIYGLVAVAGAQLGLLQPSRHAGRRGAADRVHRPGRW